MQNVSKSGASMEIRSSSPLGPAITNGAANATTSRGLMRRMIARFDVQVGEYLRDLGKGSQLSAKHQEGWL